MPVFIYLGPMYAGKTTLLINLCSYYGGTILDYQELNVSTNNTLGTFKSHNDEEKECYKVNNLNDFMDKVGTTENNVYINEAQFFGDLYDFVLKYEMTKNIYVFGLDGDFERKPFGQILNIIPLADSVTKISGICKSCNTNYSLFSKRIVSNTEQYLLDETAYTPMCRECYMKP
jgi:thymidine kinase